MCLVGSRCWGSHEYDVVEIEVLGREIHIQIITVLETSELALLRDIHNKLKMNFKESNLGGK